ncbi:MAG TPA: methyltransferase domain-containing protein, partial [Longimicrobiaceae bacterium]|nr:methyltransferase domain-containing protein [Longimicrobiaceae bacterium]
IALWSAAAHASSWVHGELNAAVHRMYEGKGFIILVVLLEPYPLPRELADRRAIDITADRDAAVRDIMRALATGFPNEPRATTGQPSPQSKPVPGSSAIEPVPSTSPPPMRSSERSAPDGGGGATVYPKPAHTQAREKAFRYRDLFRMASLELPYVALINNSSGYRYGEVDVEVDDSVYELPAPLRDIPLDSFISDDPKCRLVRYQHKIGGLKYPPRLVLRFSKIYYGDYLRSGEHLDDPLPDDPERTFRDVYAPEIGRERGVGASPLPNITGVGLFVITRDNKILITKHSSDVRVYGDVFSYSASGTMDWNDNPNPFLEVARECAEEIGHRVDLDDLRLFAVGIDAAKLYYQFSFVERTGRSSEDIISAAPSAPHYDMEICELIAVPFEVEAIVERIGMGAWEPAAAATLLTLCAREFGTTRLERAIDDDFVSQRWRDVMLAEWRQRASRPGDQAIMSARYPLHRCAEESKLFAEAVHRFLGADVDDMDVLEIGCGNGRLTMGLVRRAGRLTCLDLSEDMIRMNRERLGRHAALVTYVCCFAQEYRPTVRHDVVVSSLVLIHNVDDRAFEDLVKVMQASADTIFLFEDVGTGDRRTGSTRLRSEQELLAAFRGYRVERREEYRLFEDHLLFLKLVRA